MAIRSVSFVTIRSKTTTTGLALHAGASTARSGPLALAWRKIRQQRPPPQPLILCPPFTGHRTMRPMPSLSLQTPQSALLRTCQALRTLRPESPGRSRTALGRQIPRPLKIDPMLSPSVASYHGSVGSLQFLSFCSGWQRWLKRRRPKR